MGVLTQYRKFLHRHDPFWDVQWNGAPAFDISAQDFGGSGFGTGGTTYSNMTDASARINDGIQTAKGIGVVPVLRGRYRIDNPVVIDWHCDFRLAEFISNDNDLIPILIGTRVPAARIAFLSVYAPRVHNNAKQPQNSGGWSGVGAGIECANIKFSYIHVPHISRFTEGLLVRGYGTGNNDNTYDIGYIDNNKIGLHLMPGLDGWTNANKFVGGKVGYQGTEGTLVAGAKAIYVEARADDASGPNGNYFNLNVEGAVPEYTLHSVGGAFNKYDWMRWESSSGARVFWDELTPTRFSHHNLIDGGYNPSSIVITSSANSTPNELRQVV